MQKKQLETELLKAEHANEQQGTSCQKHEMSTRVSDIQHQLKSAMLSIIQEQQNKVYPQVQLLHGLFNYVIIKYNFHIKNDGE
jgi:hypothetical protein